MDDDDNDDEQQDMEYEKRAALWSTRVHPSVVKDIWMRSGLDDASLRRVWYAIDLARHPLHDRRLLIVAEYVLTGNRRRAGT